MFGAPTAGSATAPGERAPIFDRTRLRATGIVGLVVAAVVIGGIAVDGVLPAPTAGTQNIGGAVTMTAASGWTLAPNQGGQGGQAGQGGKGQGVVLQKGDATLSAQVLSENFSGDSAAVMDQVKQALSSQVAQISYGDEHQTRISGHDTTYVLFEAIVSGASSGGSGANRGTVDGEVVCMVVSGNAVVVEVDAPQGDLQYVTSDVSSMIQTVRVTQ